MNMHVCMVVEIIAVAGVCSDIFVFVQLQQSKSENYTATILSRPLVTVCCGYNMARSQICTTLDHDKLQLYVSTIMKG